MTALASHLADYLSVRRALGFKLAEPGTSLPQLVAYVEAAGALTLTSDLMISWARLPVTAQPIYWAHRLGAARGFARYLQTIDAAAEVPPPDVFGARQERHAPYLWSTADIARLLVGARDLRPSLWAASCETFFGLIAVSGMRIAEAAGLERKDVDLSAGVVTIREAQFGRTRLVPLHETTVTALTEYAALRDELSPAASCRAFFLGAKGAAITGDVARHAFNRLTIQLGLRTTECHPRIHDLRHTFAVRTLINWYRSGADVGANMTSLSNYLGHTNPSGTYWYLSASPELMALAAARLDGTAEEAL